ncbi:Crp/Fnr family transcriptional regulator [Mucilaginibacter sp. HMF5004]|uniref:Crp/Fnr family transcriptional regulator n=1 Tax=Mucilaginibacter rivuli TaxID=2857527 RepID=UPI001C5D6B2F|nr:Crp/Fnr family transcriptional regulator [Mucilaginibacter rivuli]MBW4888947.1 Crp/Fnr family transcriptional regulator [Mucilaginibacter rivuli]
MTTISVGFRLELEARLETETYRPHHIVHAAGQVENRLWYLESGLVRAYYFDQTGKEHTVDFYMEKEMIFSYSGFWKEPSDYYLEVLEHSELIAITYLSLYELTDNFPETRILTGIFTRRRYHQELFRNRLMTWNAAERYRQFRKRYPHIFRRASVRLIASYLNMTRENLSRLMRKDL